MLKGVVALVTGGASGLGKATAERFLQQGARVVVADLPSSKGAELVAELAGEAAFAPLNVTSEEDVLAGLQLVKDKFGRLDVTVNCAGIGVAFKTYNHNQKHTHKLSDFEKCLMVNTLGTFNVAKHSAALMHENEPNQHGTRGVIVNTSSIAAYDGQMGQAAFAASKGAVAGMTLPLARDLSSIGVRVCAVAPGLFDTPLIAHLPNNVRAFLANNIPHPNTLGNPEWFAQLVQSIVLNPYMNGEVVRLDGALRTWP